MSAQNMPAHATQVLAPMVPLRRRTLLAAAGALLGLSGLGLSGAT